MSVVNVREEKTRGVHRLLEHDKFDEETKIKVRCVSEARGQFHSPKTKGKARALGVFINRIDDNERHHF